MPSPDATRLAVLIDSDNATASLTKELLDEVAKYGTPTIKRAYGDWTTQNLVGWKDELPRHAIQPIQQFAYTRGKNSTDSALIIDAMDLLYAGNVEGFVIVSSDSDFTRLATRLREAGKTVYGLGRRDTPEPFVRACDRFIYLDLLSKEPEKPAQQDPEPASGPPNLKRILSTAISSTSQEDGWSSLGEVGSYLNKSQRGVRPARVRPLEARRAGPRGAVRRGQGRARPDRAEPAVGPAQGERTQEAASPRLVEAVAGQRLDELALLVGEVREQRVGQHIHGLGDAVDAVVLLGDERD